MKKKVFCLLSSYMIAATGTPLIGAAQDVQSSPETNWQERILFTPSTHQVELERKGRVVIYSGLTEDTVRKAMDQQFERIDAMMFVRTVRTDEQGEVVRDAETGEPETEDDGC